MASGGPGRRRAQAVGRHLLNGAEGEGATLVDAFLARQLGGGVERGAPPTAPHPTESAW